MTSKNPYPVYCVNCRRSLRESDVYCPYCKQDQRPGAPDINEVKRRQQAAAQAAIQAQQTNAQAVSWKAQQAAIAAKQTQQAKPIQRPIIKPQPAQPIQSPQALHCPCPKCGKPMLRNRALCNECDHSGNVRLIIAAVILVVLLVLGVVQNDSDLARNTPSTQSAPVVAAMADGVFEGTVTWRDNGQTYSQKARLVSISGHREVNQPCFYYARLVDTYTFTFIWLGPAPEGGEMVQYPNGNIEHKSSDLLRSMFTFESTSGK
ncbi:MAG: hypothetical protein ACYC1M_03955 [Armatimonadota bacterium]